MDHDLKLMRLAEAHQASKSAKYRAMIRGRAQKLVEAVYTTPENRKAVWREWCRLAGTTAA